MLGLGHVLGYIVGTINLSNYVGTRLGATQFKEICVIAGAAIVFCVSVTSFCVEERVLLSQTWAALQRRRRLDTADWSRKPRASSGGLAMLSTIVKTTLHLPRKISAVCWITFWSWFGMYNVYSRFIQVHQLIANLERMVAILRCVYSMNS